MTDRELLQATFDAANAAYIKMNALEAALLAQKNVLVDFMTKTDMRLTDLEKETAQNTRDIEALKSSRLPLADRILYGAILFMLVVIAALLFSGQLRVG